MTPFTVILGVVTGSLAAIAFGLLSVLVIFWWIGDESPRVGAELPVLWRSAVAFTAVAAASGASLYGTLKRRGWRYLALGATVAGIAALGWYYWPS